MDTKQTKTIAMKHTLISRFTLLSLIIFLFTKCEKDERALNMDLTEVKNRFTPVDGESITLKPASVATVTFKWEQAKAADGVLVLYEVAFDQENGDFASPFYTIASHNRGVHNKLSLTHGDLNKIAELGG